MIIGCQNDKTININNSEKYKGYLSYKKGLDLHYLTSYSEGVDCAKRNNLPIFLQFTGHGCVGDDEFINYLVNSKKIRKALNNDFVTIILYVDERKKLNEFGQIYNLQLEENSIERIKRSKTIGSLNASIQMDKFQSNRQPMYILMTDEKELLIEPFEYVSRDKNKFLNKLKEGLKNLE